MFQSSRTASGMARLHASSAFAPSSASMIWKSSPSRIRRATLRMTLESSTTRHVLIFGLYFHSPTGDVSIRFLSTLRFLCRHQIRHDFEDAIDIEDDHELSVEAVDAAGELGHAGIEIDGVFLAAVVGQPEHLADLVDQEAVGLAAQVDANRHRRLAVVVFGQPEPGPHVDDRDDAAAQVEHAGDLGR